MSVSVETLALAKKYTDEHSGGSGGTTNYNQLTNKPSINGVELVGNKTTNELGIKDGQTPNITTGTVETLPAGSSVTASITGQTPNLVLNLGIPQGQQGDTGEAATVTVGTTTTGAPGSQASVVNSGTPNAAVLDFTIPSGQTGTGLPPTDTAQDGYVPTFRDGAILWEPPAGGNTPWRLINTISLTEEAKTILVSQDSEGNPFEVDELLVRGWLTCAESTRKNANIGVNGSSQNIAGNLAIIKNMGYFGPCEIHIYDDCDIFRADVIYTDSSAQTDPPSYYNYISSARAVELLTFPSVPYEKITSFGIMCTDASVTFSEKCMLQIYGR